MRIIDKLVELSLFVILFVTYPLLRFFVLVSNIATIINAYTDEYIAMLVVDRVKSILIYSVIEFIYFTVELILYPFVVIYCYKVDKTTCLVDFEFPKYLNWCNWYYGNKAHIKKSVFNNSSKTYRLFYFLFINPIETFKVTFFGIELKSLDFNESTEIDVKELILSSFNEGSRDIAVETISRCHSFKKFITGLAIKPICNCRITYITVYRSIKRKYQFTDYVLSYLDMRSKQLAVPLEIRLTSIGYSPIKKIDVFSSAREPVVSPHGGEVGYIHAKAIKYSNKKMIYPDVKRTDIVILPKGWNNVHDCAIYDRESIEQD